MGEGAIHSKDREFGSQTIHRFTVFLYNLTANCEIQNALFGEGFEAKGAEISRGCWGL
jgi:hypothetical protein